MLAVCDEGCKKQFEVTKFKEKTHKNNVIETYFRCPHCNKKYVCFFTDDRIRKKQSEVRRLSNNPANNQRIEQLQAELKEDMNRLKKKMLGAIHG